MGPCRPVQLNPQSSHGASSLIVGMTRSCGSFCVHSADVCLNKLLCTRDPTQANIGWWDGQKKLSELVIRGAPGHWRSTLRIPCVFSAGETSPEAQSNGNIHGTEWKVCPRVWVCDWKVRGGSGLFSLEAGGCWSLKRGGGRGMET